MENSIGLKSVSELLGMKFFIPSYQRGYRWKQQVGDLLNDVNEFEPKVLPGSTEESWYCLQPLVVKEMDSERKKACGLSDSETWYEVIDGQQRLTTIFIILKILGNGENPFSLNYQTRSKSEAFLNGINDNGNDSSNIDFHFMGSAKETVVGWKNNGDSEKKIVEKLKKYCKVIWYETDELDPIKVFTRLNIGKISLTNAELIKALFLNRSNFDGENLNFLRLRQQEIASEWDRIEYTLQNEEFWLFIHEKGYDRPTRIDFIFDLICEQKPAGEVEDIGTDEYRTFRYFYACIKQNKLSINDCWAKVKCLFQTFQEWFNDLELYHYIGYLIAIESKENIASLIEEWNKKGTKDEYVSYLKETIKDKINACNDLNKQYEINGSPKKTQCRPLLLLHNIQTIINQNREFSNKKEYELPVFYKFPFHLFKKEKWDVEHIDSNMENDLTDKDSQNEFLLNIYYSVDSKKQKEIEAFINDPNANNLTNFVDYKGRDSCLSDEEKNKIWNFTLLDSSTNRSYGNSIFAAKRRIIIGKEEGVALPIPVIKKENDQSKFSIGKEGKAKTAFIPPCTRNVFLKYYTPVFTNYNYWTKQDAEAYKQNMLKTLKEFGVKDSLNNQK